jgi:hypothetical protein
MVLQAAVTLYVVRRSQLRESGLATALARINGEHPGPSCLVITDVGPRATWYTGCATTKIPTKITAKVLRGHDAVYLIWLEHSHRAKADPVESIKLSGVTLEEIPGVDVGLWKARLFRVASRPPASSR